MEKSPWFNALGKAVDKFDLARRLGKVKGVFERTEGDKR